MPPAGPIDADPIDVLWLTKGLGPGGAERLLVSFAGLADHDRFRLHAAYLLPWKDHLVAELEANGVSVTCLDGDRPWDLRWLLRLRALIASRGIEVVHNHSPLVAAQARLAVRSLRPRPALVTTEHNMWGSHRGPTRLANRLTIGGDDHVFAVSDEVVASMNGQAELLEHGVDVEAIRARCSERAEARAELGLGDDDLVVVTVANLRANKDYPNLLEAARLVLAQRSDVTFLAVGQGPLEADLQRHASRLDLGAGFRFLGHQADPVRVLVGADVFVLASRYEGLPIAMLEAMAAGLPVVATSVGGVPSIIRSEHEGRLVAAGDAAALAQAVLAVLEPAVRERLAAAATERSADYGIGPAVQRQQEVYAELAAARSFRRARGRPDRRRAR